MGFFITPFLGNAGSLFHHRWGMFIFYEAASYVTAPPFLIGYTFSTDWVHHALPKVPRFMNCDPLDRLSD